MLGDDIKASELDGKLAEKEAAAVPGKEAILAALTANFAEVHKDLESVRNGFLGSEAELFGKPTTKRGVFTWLDTAVAEQFGQAIAYAHAIGVVVPWSAGELR